MCVWCALKQFVQALWPHGYMRGAVSGITVGLRYVYQITAGTVVSLTRLVDVIADGAVQRAGVNDEFAVDDIQLLLAQYITPFVPPFKD